MKLAVVAVDVDVDVVVDVDSAVERDAGVVTVGKRGRKSSATVIGTVLALVALPALMAPPASALDGIDLSKEAEPVAAGECPALIQIKYPFLSCASGRIGLASRDGKRGNATWENSRQIPRQGDFNEGNGYWGDELNRD